MSALNTLSKEGLVVHERYGYVDITPQGEKLARSIQKTHNLLYTFLKDVLDIDEATASEDACKMEHVMSSHTIEKLTEFIVNNNG